MEEQLLKGKGLGVKSHKLQNVGDWFDESVMLNAPSPQPMPKPRGEGGADGVKQARATSAKSKWRIQTSTNTRQVFGTKNHRSYRDRKADEMG